VRLIIEGQTTLITTEEGTTNVSGSISVGSVPVTRRMTPEEEREEEEDYGEENPGAPKEPHCQLGYPVNCATGNQIETQTDLSVGGRGPSLDLTRTYNSRLAAKQNEHSRGPFGYGWTGSYSAHLSSELRCQGLLCNEEVITVTQDNGSTVRFAGFTGGKTWKPIGPLVEATLTVEGSEYVYMLPNQSVLRFNGSGRLTSETDRDGNTLTMAYESKGHLESISDAAGRKITLTYNSEGLVESAKDPMGHVVKYTYKSGALASVTQPGETSLRWQFKYNSSHELTSETDGRSHTVTTEYDSFYHVIS
jgi:YD repeat-containing protein